MVDMKMGIDYHTNIGRLKVARRQRLDQPVRLVRHAGVNDNVMMAAGQQRAGGASPISREKDFRFPRVVIHELEFAQPVLKRQVIDGVCGAPSPGHKLTEPSPFSAPVWKGFARHR